MTHHDQSTTDRTTETRVTETNVREDAPTERETAVHGADGWVDPEPAERTAGWATELIVRAAVALFGLTLLLFALGQLVGVDLLSAVGEFLTSSVGTWVLVALFALLLVFAASRRWGVRRTM